MSAKSEQSRSGGPLAALVGAACLGLLCQAGAAAGDAVTFNRGVRAVLKEHCGVCHRGSRASAGLDLSSYAALLDGSVSGEVVVSGRPEESLLYLVMTFEEEPAMPPGGEPAPGSAIEIVRQWIEGGLRESGDSPPMPIVAMPARTQQATAIPPTSHPDSGTVPGAPALAALRPYAASSLATSTEAGLLAAPAAFQVHLFDLSTRQLARILAFPEGEAKVVRFAQGGSLLLAAGGTPAESGRAVLWNTETGERVGVYGDEPDSVLAADTSPDAKLIAIGGPERLIKVFDTATGELVRTVEKHTDWVLSLAYSPEGLLLATADRAGNVYIWERHSGALLHTLRGHKGAVTAVVWGQTDDLCATACEDGVIRIWRMDSGALQHQWTAHSAGVLATASLPDGSLISTGRDKRIRCWEWDSSPGGEAECQSLPLAVAAGSGGGCYVATLHKGLGYAASVQGAVEPVSIPAHLATNQISKIDQRIPAFQFAQQQRAQPGFFDRSIIESRLTTAAKQAALAATALRESREESATAAARTDALQQAIEAEQSTRQELSKAYESVHPGASTQTRQQLDAIVGISQQLEAACNALANDSGDRINPTLIELRLLASLAADKAQQARSHPAASASSGAGANAGGQLRDAFARWDEATRALDRLLQAAAADEGDADEGD